MAKSSGRAAPSRLIAGTIWFLLFMILSGLASFLFTVFLSRRYGPEGYGIFNTTSAFYTFAWALFLGGVSEGLMKYGSEYMKKSRWKLITYFASGTRYLVLLGTVICSFILALSFMTSSIRARIILIVLALSLFFSSFKDVIASIIGSSQKINYLSVIKSSRPFFVFASGLILIALNVSVTFVPIVILAGVLGELILGSYFLKKHFSLEVKEIIEKKLEFTAFKRVYLFGLFISLSLIAFHTLKSLDVIAVKFFMDYRDVGIYSVADGYSGILFYMTSIALPLIPAISEAFARKDSRLLNEYVNIGMKYTLIIGVALTTIVLAMSEHLVVDFYGEAFSGAVLPLRILIIGTFMVMLSYNLSSIFIGLGKARVCGIVLLTSAIAYGVLLSVLIPMYNIVGAALALTLTSSLAITLISYYIKKSSKVKLPEGNLKILSSALVMGTFLYFIPKFNSVFVILDILLALALFLSSLYITGYISKKDIRVFKEAISSFRPKR